MDPLRQAMIEAISSDSLDVAPTQDRHRYRPYGAGTARAKDKARQKRRARNKQARKARKAK